MKEIRFSELVKTAGNPKTVTLWTKPAKNKSFHKAVQENRVLTVVQQTHGSHKDFGLIGFHKQPLALYLVFPRHLPKSDAHVIGLKYDLVEEPEVKNPVRSSEPEKEIPRQVERRFEVVVKRTAILKTHLSITAKNETGAKTEAMRLVKEQAFDAAQANIQDRVEEVKELGPRL